MAEKFEETAIIIRQEEIADDIYSMWLHTDQIAAHAKAGGGGGSSFIIS